LQREEVHDSDEGRNWHAYPTVALDNAGRELLERVPAILTTAVAAERCPAHFTNTPQSVVDAFKAADRSDQLVLKPG
jgi:hypothetical protein